MIRQDEVFVQLQRGPVVPKSPEASAKRREAAPPGVSERH
jgi:hypothetical protein